MSTTIDAPASTGRPRRAQPGHGRTRKFSSYGPLGALVVVSAIFALINPSFLTPANAVTILDQAAVPLVLALGLTFVVLIGCIDLSVEGVMAASGLTFALLSLNTTNANNWGFAAALVALALGVASGILVGLVHTRLRVPSFIATLGFWYIGLGLATLLYGGSVTQLTDTTLVAWISASPLGITNSSAIAMAAALFCLALSRWTRFGRYAYAIGDNEDVARLSGVPVNRFKIYIFAFSGLCAAAAGIMGTLRLGAGVVEVGSGQVFFTVAAVVVGGTMLSGGRGGIGQSIVGVLLLTVVNNGLVLSGVTPNVQQAVFGIIIIAAVITAGLRRRDRLKVVK